MEDDFVLANLLNSRMRNIFFFSDCRFRSSSIERSFIIIVETRLQSSKEQFGKHNAFFVS